MKRMKKRKIFINDYPVMRFIMIYTQHNKPFKKFINSVKEYILEQEFDLKVDKFKYLTDEELAELIALLQDKLTPAIIQFKKSSTIENLEILDDKINELEKYCKNNNIKLCSAIIVFNEDDYDEDDEEGYVEGTMNNRLLILNKGK